MILLKETHLQQRRKLVGFDYYQSFKLALAPLSSLLRVRFQKCLTASLWTFLDTSFCLEAVDFRSWRVSAAFRGDRSR
jgi:hypothetical protein